MAPSTHGQGICGPLDVVRRPLRWAPASSDQQVLGLAAAWGKHTAEAGGEAWWGAGLALQLGLTHPEPCSLFHALAFPLSF